MTTDIRKGDLIKFTHRENPEITFTTRAMTTWTGTTRRFHAATLDTMVFVEDYHVEVLDRPLPPIDEELLRAVRGAYIGHPIPSVADTGGVFREDWVRVINTVREYDRKNTTKENA